jgi:RNA recognition motif-containing protein
VAGGGERLFVSNLPKHVAEQELLQIFGPFGQVTELQLLRRADGSSKGSAFVAFQSAAESAAACNMLARYVLPGAARPMTIKSSTQKRTNKPRVGYGMRSEPIFGKNFDRERSTSVVAGKLHGLGSRQITNFVNPASPSSGSSSGDGVAGGDSEGLLASVTAGEVPSKDRPVAAPAMAASAWA